MTPGIVQPVNPRRKPATANQRRVFDFICARRGMPPTFREIAKHMGWSGVNFVEETLRQLEKKGWIRRGHYQQNRALVPRTAEIED